MIHNPPRPHSASPASFAATVGPGPPSAPRRRRRWAAASRAASTRARSASASPGAQLRKPLPVWAPSSPRATFSRSSGCGSAVLSSAGIDHLVDLEGEGQAAEVGLLERADGAQPRAEPLLDDGVEGLSVAHAAGDERDGLALERVLEAVADEAGDVGAHMHGRQAAPGQQRDRPLRRDAGRCRRTAPPRPAGRDAGGSRSACRAPARARVPARRSRGSRMADVLEASTASGGASSPRAAKISCLTSRISGPASTTSCASATAAARSVAVRRRASGPPGSPPSSPAPCRIRSRADSSASGTGS